MYQLRTVDVWDTLLRRSCHPECIKLLTAHHIYYAYIGQFKESFSSPQQLYRQRLTSESVFAEKSKLAGSDDEYKIVDVIRHLLQTALHNHHVDIEEAAIKIAANELIFESERTFADAGIADFLEKDYQSHKTIFLSDFYMGAPELKHLLEIKNLSHLISDGVCSSDTGLNKRSGRLFKQIHEQYGIHEPSEHIHIGDNIYTDVEVPRRLGIIAFHYLPDDQHSKRLEREELFNSRHALFSHLAHSGSKEAKRHTEGAPIFDKKKFELGERHAPVLIGFTLYVAEQSLLKKIDKFFISDVNEVFFKQLFLCLFPHGKLAGHKLPVLAPSESDAVSIAAIDTFTLTRYLQEQSSGFEFQSQELLDLLQNCTAFKDAILVIAKAWSVCLENYAVTSTELMEFTATIANKTSIANQKIVFSLLKKLLLRARIFYRFLKSRPASSWIAYLKIRQP